ncbi:class I SAM-dependent methyltransferase [Thermodesulfobacteriota bacterium]
MAHAIAGNYYSTTRSRSHKRDVNWYRHSSFQKMLRIRQWLPQNRDTRILDLGCGCGELLFGLEQKGYHQLTGIDCCQAEVDEAKQFVNSHLICGDAVDYLKTTEDRFDIIIAYNFLEHFSKDSLLVILRNIRKILNPGGSLIAMVPNAVSIMGSTTRYWDITHEMTFTTNNWHQLAALVGFDPLPEFRECGPVAHGPASFVRYLLWRLFRLAIKTYLLCEVATDRGNIYTQDMMVRLKASE